MTTLKTAARETIYSPTIRENVFRFSVDSGRVNRE